MITYVVGNLFESPARVLVNTVNTVGVMGKGIAKDFKTVYPEMFVQYQSLCEKNMLSVGQLWLYKTEHKWILNFPTKKHWRSPSKLSYIEQGLKKFSETYAERGITSIAFPALGCGNGGLDWEKQVRPLMEDYLGKLPIDVFVYLYRQSPFSVEHKSIKEVKKWLRSEPQSLPFSELLEDIEGLLETSSTFSTSDNRKFNVSLVKTPAEGIQIKEGSDTLFVDFESLMVLWQHIRKLGFYIGDCLPFGLGEYSQYLFAILRQLPYLKPVLVTSDYDGMNQDSIGLQYISDSITEGSLFGSSIDGEL